MRQERSSRRHRDAPSGEVATEATDSAKGDATAKANGPDLNPLFPHLKEANPRRRPSVGSESSGLSAWPTRHPRYLSDFSDNIIQIDVSHHQALGRDFLTLDLQTQLIACVGPRSHYREPQPLVNFPHAIEAFKVSLLRALERHHEGKVGTNARECWRGFLRVMSWMTRRNVFHLADLNRDLVDALVADVALQGWAKALRQTALLRELLSRASKDRDLFRRIYDRHRKAKNFVLPIEAFEEITGLPLYEWAIPRSIYEGFAKLEADSRPIKKQDSPMLRPPSLFAVQDLMTVLNGLAVSTSGSIPYVPFPNIREASRKAIHSAKAHRKTLQDKARNVAPVEGDVAPPEIWDEESARLPTANLSVQECALLLEEALEWVYDYAPGIFATIRFARERLKGIDDRDTYAQKKAWNEIYVVYEREAARVNLPIRSISQRNQGAQSLRQVVKILQYAIYVDLAINSGRRSNELIGGRGAPYGPYRGALVQVLDQPPIYRMDFYVSKGLMEWLHFPANRLMADAYFVLEELYRLHEPFDAPASAAPMPEDEARKRKLFTNRPLTPGSLDSDAPPHEFNMRERDAFLALAGVSPERFERRNAPFRRAFSVMFMHRYDLREHPALKTSLAHLDASTTGGYFNDKRARPPGESIRELHAPDYVDKNLLKELEVAGLEYLEEQLLKMLSGEMIGGGFPAIAAKLARKLSSTVSFATLSNELKANELARRLHEAGHRPSPMPHTCCMAGQPKATGEKAKCYRDGSLHREDASAERCADCVHSSANNAYLENIKDELASAEARANDFTQCAALQQSHQRCVRILQAVIVNIERAGRRNKNLFEGAQAEWEATVAIHIRNGTPNGPNHR